jgi:hypothetical protein
MQPVATREENPLSNAIPYWSSSENRFKNSDSVISQSSGIVTVAGTQTIDLGTGALPTAPAASTVIMRLAGTDANNLAILGDGWNNPGIQLQGRRANGTRALPTACTNNNNLLRLQGLGHDGTNYVDGVKGEIAIQVDGAWTGISNGIKISFYGTSAGSTTQAAWGVMRKGAFVWGATDVVSTEIARFATGTDATTITPGATDFLVGGGGFNAGGNGKVAGTLTVGGAIFSKGQGVGVTTTSINYNVTGLDQTVLVNAISGAVNITLPVGILGTRYQIKKIDSTSNIVNILTTSSQLIDGYSSYILSVPKEDIVVIFDGTSWQIER